jgi:hypothetical protein
MTFAACHGLPRTPSLHYLPGFVAGSENIFQPIAIAVMRTTDEHGFYKVVAGGVYSPDGKLTDPVVVTGIQKTVTAGLERALADAGLKPVAFKPWRSMPPAIVFTLRSYLASVKVSKQFGAQQTVHGQYFTMDASVTIAYEMRDRAGKVVFSKRITGAEHEPPTPVGHEVFFPLETDPIEALSVAMSRAIGGLMIDPGFRALMPARPKASAPPPSAP